MTPDEIAKCIPDEVVEAAAERIWLSDYPGDPWMRTSELTKRIYRDVARTALASGLAAWKGAFYDELEDATGVYRKLILPLKETPDGK
jgi:hypothetical protein